MAGELVKAQSNVDGKLNRRSTEQREIILETIQRADKHLDADEIYQLARQKSRSISLSTVYRSLQLFKELELIEEHQFNGTRRYYEITPHSKHQHMVCLGCGRIFEFKCPSSERLKSEIGRDEGFKVTDAEVRLLGYCPECQQQLAANATDIEK
jgi:Fur family ferric uptake transcriptional regulator